MVKPTDDGAVRPVELAEILGVTKGRVSQMTKAGMPKRPDGRINVAEARAWIDANVERRASRGLFSLAEPSPPPADAPEDYAALRAKHEALKADMTALRLAREAGTTVTKDEVQAAIYARARLEREAHENFVVRVAPLLAADLGAPEGAVLAALDRHMRQHLEDLSRLPLEIFDDEQHDHGLGG
ncbi:hypothetical protein [Pararhodospirillum oryzae]|uniref:Uncharacterized protein n=1 Tax=Pararhodospirillum oryzae TaxID=478448 RepID=A0A512H927_9PROT|nr:hypothetical protein [Pararhodospirillum oryzae]GEO81954.1 hypothetical protein ROR02_20850 [Pararhodospirillum oryzae]